MQYNGPLDQPANPNAHYTDGNPAAGIQGSIVPAASIELDQREVVEVISRANIRGYTDFDDHACAPPANSDLTQLRKAIEGFIRSIPSPPGDLIDSQITFHVHGTNPDFADLNVAFEYLSKYKITHQGFVTLQIAAGQWTYSGTMTQFDHPNQGHIGIVGQAMHAPIPPPSSFAQNGNSSNQRYSDTQTNLAMLRTKFATELHYTQGAALTVMGTIGFLDGLLVTGDGTVGPVSDGQMISCCGAYDSYIYWTGEFAAPPQGISSGLAAVQGGWGFTAIGGAETTNFWSGGPLIAIGSHWSGFIGNSRSAIWCNAGAYSFSNAGEGFDSVTSTGMSVSGGYGLVASCNAGHGILCSSSSSMYASTGYTWKNAAWGCYTNAGSFSDVALDFGVGSANANGAGSINASINSSAIITGSANWSPSSPPFWTTGNVNSSVVG